MSNPYQNVVRVQVPLEQLDEFQAITSGTYSTILLSPEQVIERRLDWEQRNEYTAIVSASFQQSGSFYGISVIGNLGIDLEEATRRFQERLNADDQMRRMFLYGDWPSNEMRNALEKSKKTLIENLNNVQRMDFLENGCFYAKGSESGYEYEIHPYDSFGIRFIKDEIFLCATTNKKVPIYDEMLIIKLFIETDEYGFVQKCNFRNPDTAEKLYKRIGLREKPSWRQYLPF